MNSAPVTLASPWSLREDRRTTGNHADEPGNATPFRVPLWLSKCFPETVPKGMRLPSLLKAEEDGRKLGVEQKWVRFRLLLGLTPAVRRIPSVRETPSS